LILLYLGIGCFAFAVFFGIMAVLAAVLHPIVAIPFVMMGGDLCSMGMLLVCGHFARQNWPAIKKWLDQNLD
jgi:hypothetical protein